MRGRSLSGYQRKRVWLNDGAGPLHRRRAGGRRHRHLRRPRGRAGRPSEPRRARRDRGQPARAAARLQEHRRARRGTGSSSSWRARPSNRSAIGARVELHWNGQRQVQESAAASGFSAQNQRRLHYGLGAAAAVDRVVIRWPSGGSRRSSGRRSIAAPRGGTAMSSQPSVSRASAARRCGRRPARSTTASCRRCSSRASCSTAHLSFGILEGYERTALAIVTAIAAELVLGRITYGEWPHPASAYITGISAGILVRSPFLWPYFLCSPHLDHSRSTCCGSAAGISGTRRTSASARVLFLAPGHGRRSSASSGATSSRRWR